MTVALVVVGLAVSAAAVIGVARYLSSAPRAVADSSQGAGTPAPDQVATAVPSAVETTAEPAAATPPVPATTEPAVLAPAPWPEFSTKRYLGKALHTVPNTKHEVALTFDDGPSPDTAKVLAILREHDVHATFFVVGRRARSNSSALKEIVAQGHEVGNHTWTHPEPGAISESDLGKQFDRTQKLVTDLTGQTPRFARTRGGKYTDATMASLTERKLILSLWNIHSNDVEPSPSPEQIVKNATGGATSGSIILMHETNPNTIKALPAVLKALERKGLHPVTMSQLVSDDSRAK